MLAASRARIRSCVELGVIDAELDHPKSAPSYMTMCPVPSETAKVPPAAVKSLVVVAPAVSAPVPRVRLVPVATPIFGVTNVGDANGAFAARSVARFVTPLSGMPVRFVPVPLEGVPNAPPLSKTAFPSTVIAPAPDLAMVVSVA